MSMMVVVMSLMLSLNIFHTFFYSPAHNILELYNVLAQVRCATSTTKFVIQYNQLVLRVDSRVAEQLNTQDLNKLGNIRKISNLDEDLSQSLVSPQEIKLWQWQLKYSKSISETFLALSNFTGFLYPAPDIWPELYYEQVKRAGRIAKITGKSSVLEIIFTSSSNLDNLTIVTTTKKNIELKSLKYSLIHLQKSMRLKKIAISTVCHKIPHQY